MDNRFEKAYKFIIEDLIDVEEPGFFWTKKDLFQKYEKKVSEYVFANMVQLEKTEKKTTIAR
jgi:hypothetical protein